MGGLMKNLKLQSKLPDVRCVRKGYRYERTKKSNPSDRKQFNEDVDINKIQTELN
jgi:hypothetical protein